MAQKTPQKAQEEKPYLTEHNLEHILRQLYQDSYDFVKNKRFYYEGRHYYEADYYSESKALVVEFDGAQHYSEPSVIVRDRWKDLYFQEQHITVIRIPYFVQISPQTSELLFGIKSPLSNNYPHGFISEAATCVLPAAYCELGVQRFKEDLQKFACIRKDIIESLRNRPERDLTQGDIRLRNRPERNLTKDYILVVPPSLDYLLESNP